MNFRKLGVLLIALAICSLLAFQLTKTRQGKSSVKLESSRLLSEDLDLNNTSRIHIKKSGSEVIILKKDNTWLLENLFDFPVNMEKLQDNLQTLVEVDDAELRKGGEKYLDEFGLDESQAMTLELKDQEGKLLFKLQLGDQHDTTGGRFALNREAQVVLLSESLSEISKDPIDWVEKELIRIAANDVKEAVLSYSNVTLHVSKNESNEFILDGLDETKEQLKTSNLNRLFGAFSRLDLTSIKGLKAEQKETSPDNALSIRNKEGLLIKAAIYKSVSGETTFSFEVSHEVAAKPEQGDLEQEAYDKELKAYEEALAQTKKLVTTLTDRSKWLYEINSYASDPIEFNRSDLVEEMTVSENKNEEQ